MAGNKIKFDKCSEAIFLPSGSLITEAARLAGVEINQPCGGQGRCGRCAVQVISGAVRRRSTLRLSEGDVKEGFALACQTVIEGDADITIPPQDKIERRLTTDRLVADIKIPEDYDPSSQQTIKRISLSIAPPDMEDQTDDVSRLKTVLRREFGYDEIFISLDLIRKIGSVLREDNWQITAVIDEDHKTSENVSFARIIDLKPGKTSVNTPIWGMAVDIGTTTVTVWIVNLLTGEVAAQASEYNGQITRGEDIISRIIYSSKNGGDVELQALVIDTIHQLIEKACKRIKGEKCMPSDIVKATISGNSTMMHLFLKIPAISIRLSPFVTAVNKLPALTGRESGLKINQEASVICLPGVASYVGSDITAGVYSSGMDDTTETTLFMDVGTNGEIVLGSHEWLVTCACSAGPAFEGAGIQHGVRATKGAIEEVWINSDTFEPTLRVIGGGRPVGICGSGLISIIAEMFMTGIIDKGGNIKSNLGSKRVREGEHGMEYVLAWGNDIENDSDIVITTVDIDNLLRAKGAIFAGYQVLASSVGITLEMIKQMLIGGSFGKYINIEKGIEIGLLPDLEWEKFHFLGNTSVKGAYYALLNWHVVEKLTNIADKMTYIELSADNSFYEKFMSALFLPHTDLSLFPSVKEAIEKQRDKDKFQKEGK